MIPSRRLLAAIALVVMVVATPALAEWVVARVSQPARYAVDGRSWRPLEVGMEVPNHAWVHTGRTGRLLLRDSGDVIQFKPNTVAAVSRRAGGAAEATTILQKFGSLLMMVDPRPGRSMSVETPYMALIVKGTRFEVDVDRTSVEMRVHEGIVEAIHPTRGKHAHIYPGQVALAQGHRRFAVRGAGPGPEPRIVPVEPREPRVSPATPARDPVQMSTPHSSSDSGPETEPLANHRHRESRERLIQLLSESATDHGDKKRDRRERKDDRRAPDRVDDREAPNDDPGGDADGDPRGETNTGADEPSDSIDDSDEVPESGDPDEEVDETPESEDPEFGETLAPTWTSTRATRHG